MAVLALLLTSSLLAAARAADTPTISVEPATIVFGQKVELSGLVSPSDPAVPVTILARKAGDAGYTALAKITPGPTGRWSYRAKPGIGTSFRIRDGDQTSDPVSVSVRPLIELQFRGGVLTATVTAARSFNGKRVFVQRQIARRWVTVASAVLRRPAGQFGLTFRSGTYRLRALIPRTEVGPGYLAGISAPLTIRRA